MSEPEQSSPTNPVEQTYTLAKEGKTYASLLTWFEIPEDQRTETLIKTLKLASQIKPQLSWITDRKEIPPLENFLLKNFSILSSKVTQKLLMPTEGMEATDADIWEIEDHDGRLAWTRFNKLVEAAGIKFSADMDDFPSPSQTFTHFSLEEEREFLLKLSEHLPPDSDLFLFSGISLMRPIEHCDLLADPRLTKYVEETILISPAFEHLLANYLVRGVFPSTEFFEEIFRRMPEETKPDAEFSVPTKKGSVDIPASLYYFTMLRRINQIPKDIKPEKLEERRQRIVRYLLNDQFMQRALSYLETDKLYGNKWHEDYFIPEGHLDINYQVDIETTGDEAKKIKRERLGEVLKTAIDYAREKGDEQTVQRLTEREVGGVKFADFLT